MTTNELKFADFLNRQEPEAEVDTQLESNEAADTQQEAVVASTEAQPLETQEQEPPSTAAAVSLEDLLRQKGIHVEDSVDRTMLYENVISRAVASTEALAEVARLQSEIESLRSLQASAAPTAQTTQEQPKEPEAQAEQRARRFRELQQYDPYLDTLVTRDERGFAKPIPEYGAQSVEAARSINEYEKASREQADLLLKNPLSVVEDAQDTIARIAEERAKRIVEEQLGKIREETERAQQEAAARQAEQQRQQQLAEWHEANKAKLFHLQPDGQPAKDYFGTGEVAWTQYGAQFNQKLNQLRSRLPGVSEIELRNLALELTPQQQAQAVPVQPAQAPAYQPPQTQSELKRTLAQNRQAIPNQNIPQANVHQAMPRQTALKLADMVYIDPANSDRVTSWGR